MCGLVGFWNNKGDSNDAVLSEMRDAIRHRGPDDAGNFSENIGESVFMMAHRRLSIIELSSLGHQPMVSHGSKYVMVFNGEIYNHLAIRSELQQQNGEKLYWNGESDTETVVMAFEIWGLEKTLEKLVGMFAIAVWDKKEKILTLARDRMGEKPLYYGWQGSDLLFVSELKALEKHPSFQKTINWNAAAGFLRYNYIQGNESIYHGIYKLSPGSFVSFSLSDLSRSYTPEIKSFWSIKDTFINSISNPFKGSYKEACTQLEVLLINTIQMQSVANVNVGAFLSGGIDSSLVVALMKSATSSKVKTFSIGMPDQKMNESVHAIAVANYLGTEHLNYHITAKEALDLLPSIHEVWDEPFADSSQLPTLLVSRLAKQKVTVSLSGDGGDELFLGYAHYSFFKKILKTRILRHLPLAFASNALSTFNSLKLQRLSKRSLSLANAWAQPDMSHLSMHWLDRYRGNQTPLRKGICNEILPSLFLQNTLSSAAFIDATSYLPNDIMVKVDRAAMAVSLETRAPFLDHRIVEFAFGLPEAYKMNKNVSKRILRDILYKYVPRQLVDRPKQGFSIPLNNWLRLELREWAESLLSSISPNSEIWDKQFIEKLWKNHLSCRFDNTEQLWSILMLQSFLLSKNILK